MTAIEMIKKMMVDGEITEYDIPVGILKYEGRARVFLKKLNKKLSMDAYWAEHQEEHDEYLRDLAVYQKSHHMLHGDGKPYREKMDGGDIREMIIAGIGGQKK